MVATTRNATQHFINIILWKVLDVKGRIQCLLMHAYTYKYVIMYFPFSKKLSINQALENVEKYESYLSLLLTIKESFSLEVFD